MHKRNNFT